MGLIITANLADLGRNRGKCTVLLFQLAVLTGAPVDAAARRTGVVALLLALDTEFDPWNGQGQDLLIPRHWYRKAAGERSIGAIKPDKNTMILFT